MACWAFIKIEEDRPAPSGKHWQRETAAGFAFLIRTPVLCQLTIMLMQFNTPNELMGRVAGVDNFLVGGGQMLGIATGAALICVYYRDLRRVRRRGAEWTSGAEKPVQVFPYSSWRRSQKVSSPSSWRPIGVRSRRP